MGHKFAEIAFTPGVRAVQAALGSRVHYERAEAGEDSHHELGPAEKAFIESRDSFYMASVSETGWPYVQHRGGPAGFVTVLDHRSIAFADYRGNRQYISVGNLGHDERVALILVDYPTRTRLKLLGRGRLGGPDEAAVLPTPASQGYRARAERHIIVHVEAFDWNCPQHITPRYTEAQIEAAVRPLRVRIRELEAELRIADPGGAQGSAS